MAPTKLSLEARAIQLLSRREYSRLELQRKLAPHAESVEQLDALLDRLAERRWQSDSRFAEQWVSSKSAQYGSRYLKHTLQERGIRGEALDEALASVADSELERARAAWRKKFSQAASTPAEQARQIRFLASRGFPLGLIRQVLNGVDELLPDDE